MKRLQKPQSGFSLIELMVSMTIGIVLIGGAVYVFDEARTTLNINEKVSRMQENARWALDVLEPDIRLAGYWGRHTNAEVIAGRATSGNVLSTPVAGDCGANWSVDVETSLLGTNNEAPGWTCIEATEYSSGSDTLELRHASGSIVDTLQAGRIYVRTHEAGQGSLFVGTAVPPIAQGQNNALVAHAYFVRPYSFSSTDGRPSLRRQGLTVIGTTPTVVDQEVISGVEDLQLQFGIDGNGDRSVDVYVNPDNDLLDTNPRILAVRVWLRMRADFPEPGFSDTRVYRYADQAFVPSGAAAGFRRILVSRTIFLRNESI